MTFEKTLGDIAEIIMGQSPAGDTCNDVGEGTPLLNGPTEFGHKHPSPVQFTTDAKKVSLPNDLLFCVRGSTTGKMNWADRQYAIGRGLAAIRGKNGYPNTFIRSVIEVNLDSLLNQATGSTFPNVSRDLISSLSIPNISKESAQKIASVVEPIEENITLLRNTNSTLEAIAQALFKSWFIDFDPVRAKQEGRKPEGMDETTAAFFPDSFESGNLCDMPKGWRVGTLTELTSFQNGYAFKGKDWTESGHPVVKIGNVKPRLISLDGCSFVGPQTVNGLDRFKLHRGDLLVGMTGYVGETGLVAEVSPIAYLNQRVGRFSTKEGLSDIGFIYCLVRSKEFKTFAENKAHGSAQANVSGDDLLKFPTVIPNAKILSSFNLIIYPLIDAIISNYEKERTLFDLRITLLPRLISGQLRLPDAADQIEVALA